MMQISSISGPPRPANAALEIAAESWKLALDGELAHYVAFDLFESRFCDLLGQLTSSNPRAIDSKSHLPGHVTASGIVINSRREVLMIFHRKLRRWLQPGGHVDPRDVSLMHAAAREVKEEANVDVEPTGGALFDVDIHWIPSRPEMPGHFHFDCRYLFECRSQAAEAATDAEKAAWISISKARKGQLDPGLERIFQKLLNGHAGKN